MSDNDDYRDPIVYTPQVLKQMADDPELAEIMRQMAAEMRQAHYAWKSGQYASLNDAMEAITGNRPEPVDEK